MASRPSRFALPAAALAALLAAGCAPSAAPAANADAAPRASRALTSDQATPVAAGPVAAYEPQAFAYVSENPRCRPHLASLHRVPGVPDQWIAAALAGDAPSSHRIQRNLLVRIEGKHERAPAVLCAYEYWRDIAAQHGDVLAAYEASFPRLESPTRCARARKWAAFGLAHLDEYRKGMLADATAADIEQSLTTRRQQFEQTLATACPGTTPAPASSP